MWEVMSGTHQRMHGKKRGWVFDASGNHLGIIRLPDIPANYAWGAPEHRTMFFYRPHVSL